MVRRSAVVLVIALAACGPGTGSEGPAADAVAPLAPPERAHVSVPTEETDDVEVAALVARFVADPHSEEVRAELLVLGARGAVALTPLLAESERFESEQCEAVRFFLPHFRDDAVAPLLDLLATSDAETAQRTIWTLDHFAPVWATGPHADAVCDALLAWLAEHEPPITDPDAPESVVAHFGVDLLGRLHDPQSQRAACVLAEIFERRLPDEDCGFSFSAVLALKSLNSRAAPAASALASSLVAMDVDGRNTWADEVLDVLQRVGSAAPDALPGLLALLDDPEPGRRERTAELLSGWGSAAASCRERLLELRDDPDPRVRRAAAIAVLAQTAPQDVDDALLRSLLRDSDGYDVETGLSSRARDPAFALRLIGLLPTLDLDAAESVAILLEEAEAGVESQLVAALARSHPTFAAHSRGHILLLYTEPARPVPPAVRALLQAEDALVRSRIAAYLIGATGGADEDAVRVALESTSAEDPDARCDAYQALAGIEDPDVAVREALTAWRHDPSPWVRRLALKQLDADGERRTEAMAAFFDAAADPAGSVRAIAIRQLATFGGLDNAEVLAVVVHALDDPEWDVRTRAISALRRRASPLPELAEETLARLAADAVLHREPMRLLLRVEGGSVALENALRPVVAETPGPHGWRYSVREALRIGGFALVGLRPYLVRAIAASEDDVRDELSDLLILMNADPETMALTGEPLRLVARRLLALGSDGREPLVLLVGRDAEALDSLSSDDVRALQDPIVAATTASGERGALRRRGAARLLPWLGEDVALPLLLALAEDADDAVCNAAVRGLVRIERWRQGAVPTDAVRQALLAPRTRAAALDLVEALGKRAGALDPELRSVELDEWAPHRAHAAHRRWRLGGDVAHAADVMRSVLRDSERPLPYESDKMSGVLFAHNEVQEIDWSQVVEVLASVPLADGDTELILGVVRAWPLDALVELLARPGHDAETVLPFLRGALDRTGPRVSRPGEGSMPAVLRALMLLGTDARPALPELRRWIAETHDPYGHGAEVLRALGTKR